MNIITHVRRPGSLLEWPTRGLAAHTRAGSAYYIDASGVLQSAGTNVIRSGHWVTDNTGIARQTCLLEQAFTNLVTSDNLAVDWSKGGATGVTGGISDPAGGTGAYRVEDDDGVLQESLYKVVLFTGDGVKAVCFVVREATMASSGNQSLALYDQTAAAFRVKLDISAWVGGSPSVAASFGTYLGKRYVGNGYWVLLAQGTVTAANSNRLFIYPAVTAAATGSIDVWRVNAFNSPIPLTAGWLNASSSQAVDITTLPFTTEIREMSGMVEFVEGGAAQLTNSRLFHVGAAAGTGPALYARTLGTGRYRLGFTNAAASDSLASLSAGLVTGDYLRVWWWLEAVGAQVRINARQSVNGSAFSSTVTGSLVDKDAANFSAGLYAINSWGNGTLACVNNHIRHRVYPGYVPAEAF